MPAHFVGSRRGVHMGSEKAGALLSALVDIGFKRKPSAQTTKAVGFLQTQFDVDTGMSDGFALAPLPDGLDIDGLGGMVDLMVTLAREYGETGVNHPERGLRLVLLGHLLELHHLCATEAKLPVSVPLMMSPEDTLAVQLTVLLSRRLDLLYRHRNERWPDGHIVLVPWPTAEPLVRWLIQVAEKMGPRARASGILSGSWRDLGDVLFGKDDKFGAVAAYRAAAHRAPDERTAKELMALATAVAKRIKP